MNVLTRFLGLALVLTLVVAPTYAQQGEGTGADFEMATGTNANPLDAADKSVCTSDIFNIQLASPLGSYAGAGVVLLGDIAPMELDINTLPGTLDLGVGLNFFVITDGINDPLGPKLNGSGLAGFSFVTPATTDWLDGGIYANNPGLMGNPQFDPDNDGIIETNTWGFFTAGLVADPAGAFGLVQVSNSIKHSIGDELGELFSNTCEDALACAAQLSDADLGVPFSIADTGAYSNTLETDVSASFGTETGFNLFGPGGGTRHAGADCFVRFVATGGGAYTFDLCGSDYDSTIYLIENDCVTPIVLNDDHEGGFCVAPITGLVSALQGICLSAGQEVILAIDGFSASSAGTANLVITKTSLTIDGADLDTGDLAGGETVTFTGCNAGGVTSITFGGVPATGLTTIDANTISCVVPAGAMAGAVDIVLDNGVDSVTLTGGWTYVDNSLPSFSECSMPGLIYGDATQPGDLGPNVMDTIVVVDGAGAGLVTVSVDVDITHTFQGDNTIDITSPALTNVVLWNAAGGSADDIIGNFPNDFTPGGAGDLSEFTGEDPAGAWTLNIVDGFAGSDGGTLNMWCVNGTYAYAPASGTSSPGLIYGDSSQPGDLGPNVMDTINIATVTVVQSLSVDVDITHTFQGDNTIDLTSPALTNVVLWNAAGGSADDIIGNFPNDFTPGGAGDLSEYNGESSVGGWTLNIVDGFAGSDGGTLNSWGININ